MNPWYLIVNKAPAEGKWNMAVDEFLFRSLTDTPKTFLRFYQWKNPTVSLGYSQKIKQVVDVSFCRTHGIDIVRRITGGKLVLHHKEITYSVSSSDSHFFTEQLSDSYRIISKALMRGLELMGLKPFLADAPPSDYARGNLPCFSHPARNEVEVGGRKIIGSAQKREGSRFLQHGSIPMGGDVNLFKAVSFLNEKKGRIRLISLSAALGSTIAFDEASSFFLKGVSEFLKTELVPYAFSREDIRQIEKIQNAKYSQPNWTFMR